MFRQSANSGIVECDFLVFVALVNSALRGRRSPVANVILRPTSAQEIALRVCQGFRRGGGSSCGDIDLLYRFAKHAFEGPTAMAA